MLCSGSLINISYGGLSVKLNQFYSEGEELDIKLALDENGTKSNLYAIVQIVWTDKGNNGYHYGFLFTSMNDLQIKILNNYLHNFV